MSTQRPSGVNFISILLFVAGGIDVLGGIVLLVNRNDEELLDAIGSSESDLMSFGIVTIAIGVIILFTAVALRRAANWARALVVIVSIVRLATLVWALATYHSVHWTNTFLPTLLYCLVAGYLLFDEDARRYFEGEPGRSSGGGSVL
jgi:hypothetical protein